MGQIYSDVEILKEVEAYKNEHKCVARDSMFLRLFWILNLFIEGHFACIRLASNPNSMALFGSFEILLVLIISSCFFLVTYQLVGRLDNNAFVATGAKLAFKSNEEIGLQVRSIPLFDVIQDSEKVLLLKIDIQGWEYHVPKGASKLLPREKGHASYLIYEEDERLLQASNNSAKEIREFLHSVGYLKCTQLGTDTHCTKTD